MSSKKWLRPAVFTSLWIFSQNASTAWELNMPTGASAISNQVYDLHMLILWICVAIGIVVFGAMFYSIFSHRKSRGVEAAQFHESTTVEIIWTIVPLLILVGMTIPATQTLVAMEDSSESDLTIKITGYQWKWRYEYMDQDVDFFSTLSTPRAEIMNKAEKNENYLLQVDKPLVIPTGKKIRLLITSNDVLHAWWVPDLALKKDAVPGFINEMWAKIDEPGVYRGQCAELCGKDHGFMPIVVVAKGETDYLDWLQEQKATEETTLPASSKNWNIANLMSQGQKVYNANCVACHQVNGEGLPGIFPAIKGSAVATGALAAHMDLVMNGKPGTAMQAFSSVLSDIDLAAVITYQRNAWGNNTGDVIQPGDVAAKR